MAEEADADLFELGRVRGKRVFGAFDGGAMSTDGGVFLLGEAERRLGLAASVASVVRDTRDPARVVHGFGEFVRARVMAIACGYEDGDDLDRLRSDPAFKIVCGRRGPQTGGDLLSQPTVSRLENMPTLREMVRMTRGLVERWMDSYGASPPEAVTLDFDDTCDVTHGRQKGCLYNSHHGEHCFMPLHVYDTATGRPVCMVLRAGRTPSGREVACHIRRLVLQVRARWPRTEITIRGDSHYGRHEAMAWCEANGVCYVFGLSGNDVLHGKVGEQAEHACVERAEAQRAHDLLVESGADPDGVDAIRARGRAAAVRTHCETAYSAKAWTVPGADGGRQRTERRVIARIEATPRGLDIRYVVTNLVGGTPAYVYEETYCARGSAEGLIDMHKSQLHSDRTSCRSPVANQFRLVLHTLAYWLLLTVRDAIPKTLPLASAEFRTIQNRLLKVAVRVAEHGTRIRLSFCSYFPEAPLFASLVRHFRTQAASTA